MKIGFYCQSQSHLGMAALMLASVRESMPGVEVFHLTDEHCPGLEGVDGVRRLGAMPMAIRRMLHHSTCEGEWLFIDSDVIVQKDVRGVFSDEFDVALTDRVGTDMEGTSYGAAMPFNLGVVFSRSPQFWKRVLKYMSPLSSELKEWCGDQFVVCAMVKQKLVLDLNIKILPGLQMNFPPTSPDDPLIEQAALIHLKGNRKKFLPQLYERLRR